MSPTSEEVAGLTERVESLHGAIAEERDATRKSTRRFGQVLAVLVLLSVVALASLWWVRDITQGTNNAVTKTIPSLQHQITKLEEDNADLKTVVDQAVVVITQQLVPQIIELGGTPPQIVLDPDKAE